MIDSEKFKTISPEIILPILGISHRTVGNRIMATAVYRDERTASISVQEKSGRYLWLDFGTGQGGSWIDLVMAVKGFNYLEALKFLNEIENAEIPAYKNKDTEKKQQHNKKNKIKIISVGNITDAGLIKYLHSRAIKSLPAWLLQINYEVLVIETNKKYLNSAIGIKNIKGGYAIRNPKIKMFIGPAAFTYINNNSEIIVVVEGFFNALSLFELYENKNKSFDILILNSANNLNDNAIDILKTYKNIVLALDPDPAGTEAENKIINKLTGTGTEIFKLKFIGRDLNDELIARNLKKINLIKKALQP